MPSLGYSDILRTAEQHPHLSLYAAVVKVALDDARNGDQEAQDWLGSDECFVYLTPLAPDGIDPRQIQQALTSMAAP